MKYAVLAALLSAAFVACSDDDPSRNNDDSSNGDSDTNVPGDSDPVTGGDTDDGISRQAIHYVGRVQHLTGGVDKFAWPGSGLTATFKGTGITATISGAANSGTSTYSAQPTNYIEVTVDGVLTSVFLSTFAQTNYVLATGLEYGEHTVSIYRRNEAEFGVITFLGFSVENGALVSTPFPFAHRIELVGDSITTGYGDSGTSPCAFNAETSNETVAWGAVTAKALNAWHSAVAWEGRGMYSNYSGATHNWEPNPSFPTQPTMPEMYDRILPLDATSTWNVAGNVPDAVVINLGTNDFNGSNHPAVGSAGDTLTSNPNQDEVSTGYTATYIEFVTHLRDLYPDASIFMAVGTMSDAYKDEVQAVLDNRTTAGDDKIHMVDLGLQGADRGCNGHPNLATQAAMGAATAQAISDTLGWTVVAE